MRIELFSRYGQETWLEQVGEKGWWQLRSNQPTFLDYTRIIYDEDNEIYAIDPSGGPFISIGTVLETNYLYEISEIKSTDLGFFLKLIKREES